MSRFFLFFSICTGSFVGMAQKDTTLLQEIIITGNRSERTLDEVDRSVSVIDSDQIRRFPYQNVAELLGQEAGIYIIGQGQNPGTNQSLFLRGANSNQVNILIDGVRLSDPSTPGGSLDLSELSLINVERIEILRGSHGTMYGTSGIGGVINIITRKSQEGGILEIEAQGGAFKENGQSLKHGVNGRYQLNNGLFASAGYEQLIVNGLNAAADTTSTGDNNRDYDNFSKQDFFGQIGYNGQKLRLNVFYKDIYQRTDLDQGAFNDDDNYFLKLDRSLINYQASYDFARGSVTYIGGWSQLERATENDSSVIDDSGNFDGQVSTSGNTGTTETNEIQVLFGKDPVSMLVGAGQYAEQMNLRSYFYSSNFGGFEFSSDLDSLAIGAKSQYAFSQLILSGGLISTSFSAWQLTIGSRYTHHSQFGSQWSYEVTPGYHFNQGKVFLNLSSGYKNPSLTQLYDPAISPGYVTNRGNIELMPEKSLSLEAGWNQKFSNFEIQLGVYQNYIKNVIEYIYLWDATSGSISEIGFSDYQGDTYINLSAMKTQGMEVGIDWQVTDYLSFNANYSYMHGEMEFDSDKVANTIADESYIQLFTNGQFLTTGETVLENQLVRRPTNLWNTRLTYLAKNGIRASVSYRYVGNRPDSFYDASLGPFGALNTLSVPSYHLFDVIIGYKVSKDMNLGFRVENLLNSSYEEVQGFNTRGRGIYLKAVYRLVGGE